MESTHESHGPFSQILSLLKGLRPGTELDEKAASINAAIMDTSSVLEVLRQNYLESSENLIAADNAESPLDRIISVTKFLVGIVRFSKFKKPLNPIAGEVCFGKMQHQDNTTTFFVSEQVSHHPPTSAVNLRNDNHGIECNTSETNATTFWGKHLETKIKGNKQVILKNKGELYDLQIPNLYVRLLRYAAEYTGEAGVVCKKTGFISKLKYKSKPLMGGSWNVVKGKIYHESNPTEILCSIEGRWDQQIAWTNLTTNCSEIIHYDEKPAAWTAVLEEKSSEKVWEKFKESTDKGDTSDANRHKGEVEEAQREKSKKGRKYVPVYFTWKNGEWSPNGKLPTALQQP